MADAQSRWVVPRGDDLVQIPVRGLGQGTGNIRAKLGSSRAITFARLVSIPVVSVKFLRSLRCFSFCLILGLLDDIRNEDAVRIILLNENARGGIGKKENYKRDVRKRDYKRKCESDEDIS
jgi:hypothetical protein